MYRSWVKKESLLLLPSAPHDHLKLQDFEILELVLAFDLQLVPGNVINLAGVVIDEMMMFTDIGIEDYRTFSQRLHADEFLFDQQVERVVNSGAGDSRAFLASGVQHVIRSRVGMTAEYALDHGNPLRRRLNAALPQYRDGVLHNIWNT